TVTTIGTMQLRNGVHSITATQTGPGGISPTSSALSITIDTAAPAALPTPILDPASDSGVSNSDGVTLTTSPKINVTAGEAGNVSLEMDGNAATIVAQTIAGPGTISLVPATNGSFAAVANF